MSLRADDGMTSAGASSHPVDKNKHNVNINNEYAEYQSNCCEIILVGISYLLIGLTFPITIFMCIKIVKEYERAVIFRLGRNLSGAVYNWWN